MAAKKIYINGVEINAKLIPDLTALTAVEVTDTTKKSIAVADEDSPNNEALKMTLSELSNLLTDGSGVKIYKAKISQSGSNIPTSTILKNTIGNIVFTYIEAGIYQATLTGAFTSNKTFGFIEYSKDIINKHSASIKFDDSVDYFVIDTAINNVESDGVLNNYSLYIEVYP
jgi:hypothetical protein